MAILVGRLSEDSGGLAASVPSMTHALVAETAVEPHVVGVTDPKRPHAASTWGPRVYAHRGSGPSGFNWARSMAETVDGLDPDVLDTQGLWMNLSRVALSRHRRCGTPLVVTPRGMLDPWAIRRSAWRKRLVAKWFEDDHLASARALRALNEDEAQAIRHFGVTAPIAVVPNGIVPPHLTQVTDAGDRAHILQFVGRLDEKKGLEQLLHAWALARQSPSAADWRLQVNGWGARAFVARLERLASDLSLGETFSFGGPVFGSEKDAVFRAASGFVLPSFSEGLPMAVLEAWSWGTPALITRACNIPEGYAAGAALEISTEPQALARGILGFIECGPDERRAMSDAGRYLVETRFGAREVALRLERLYTWAVGGGDPPEGLILD